MLLKISLHIYCLTLASLLTSSLLSAAPFKANEHYTLIDPDPKKTATINKTDAPIVEITEVFWYGCPHCNKFLEVLDPWKSRWKRKYGKRQSQPQQQPASPKQDVLFQAGQVHFRLLPVVWSKKTETHAKLFYTIAQMGKLPKLNKTIFKTIHEEFNFLRQLDDILKFIEAQGIPKDEFLKIYNSPEVEAQVKQAKSLTRSYGISGTPEFIINGKYRVSSNLVSSYREARDVIEYLVNQELASLSSRNSKSSPSPKSSPQPKSKSSPKPTVPTSSNQAANKITSGTE